MTATTTSRETGAVGPCEADNVNDVTATLSPATVALSRNGMILAEWEAERARHVEYERLNPKAAEHLGALAAAFGGDPNATEEERQARSLAAHLTHCSYGCSMCRAEFSEGDVVHRRRVQLEADFTSHWGLSAVCAKCVQTCMHPSWFEPKQARAVRRRLRRPRVALVLVAEDQDVLDPLL